MYIKNKTWILYRPKSPDLIVMTNLGGTILRVNVPWCIDLSFPTSQPKLLKLRMKLWKAINTKQEADNPYEILI